jgi:GT2 family glycosyltransferase
MMTISVTIIVVNWNGNFILDQCLTHLSRQSIQPNRILIIDNGSTDGSAERAELVPGVIVRRLGFNLGFAAANNRGFEECDTEFVALLNPDAFPEPDWLARLVNAAQSHPRVAVFGSRQMVHGMTGILDGKGDVYHFSGLVWRDGHGRFLGEADNIAEESFSPCAAAALYRRQALVDVGGFDEDYFCYVEDVDLGFRLRLAGHKAMYVPNAVVHHVGSATTGGQHSDFSVYHGHRNLVWTFVKNMPGALFWLLLPMHVLLNLVTVVWFTARGQGRVILRAKWHAIKGLPQAWAKRKKIQVSRVATVREIWRVLDKRLIPSRRGR